MCAMGGRLLDNSGTISESWLATYKCIYKNAAGVSGGVAPQAFTDAAVIALQAAHKTFIQITGTSTAPLFGGFVKLDYLKMNAIDSAGHYANPVTSIFNYGASFGVGANTTGRIYWRTSVVINGRTATAKGRTANSKTFLPPLDCFSISSNTVNSPYLPTATITSLLASWKTLMTAVNSYAPGTGDRLYPANISPGDTVKGTTPIYAAVTGFRASPLPATIRTRSNKLPPVYSTTTFP